jgi:tetratricopeptide (TPR) repeat protein
VRGPGIKKNHEIHSACLLDIAPTLLHLKGLPVGEDMDGRVLRDIFETEPDIQTIPSWDAVAGEDGRHQAGAGSKDVAESREEIKQLVELGYIDEPNADAGIAVDNTIRELDYNLAQAYMDGAHFTEAAKLLRKQWDRNPREGRFGTKLLSCYLSLRDPILGRETFELLVTRKKESKKQAIAELDEVKARIEKDEARAREAAEKKGETFVARELERKDRQIIRRLRGQANANLQAFAFLEGCLLKIEGEPEGALNCFKKCQEVEEALKPSLSNNIGNAHLDLENIDTAEEAFQQTLSIAPLNSEAHLGMAKVFTARKKPFEAAASALKSLEVNYGNPKAQFLYGQALKNLGKIQMAKTALLRAVEQNPNYASAWWELSKLFKDGSKKALEYKKEGDAAQQRVMEITRNMGQTNDAASTEWAEFPEIVSKPDAKSSETQDQDALIIVSGLPRSGTSLMMQMLDAAGLTIVSDAARQANESNPKGYFEDERVKRLKMDDDKAWLNDCKGQAIKIVMPVLTGIPNTIPQKIIFMERPAEEVVLSQRTMLKRDGKIGSTTENDRISEIYAGYLKDFNNWAPKHDAVSVLPIAYHDVLADPEGVARKVAAFVKPDADIQAMAKTVDPKLYRTKKAASA